MKKKHLIVIKPAAILPPAVTVRNNVTKYHTNVRRHSDFLRKYGAGLITYRCCLMQSWDP